MSKGTACQSAKRFVVQQKSEKNCCPAKAQEELCPAKAQEELLSKQKKQEEFLSSKSARRHLVVWFCNHTWFPPCPHKKEKCVRPQNEVVQQASKLNNMALLGERDSNQSSLTGRKEYGGDG